MNQKHRTPVRIDWLGNVYDAADANPAHKIGWLVAGPTKAGDYVIHRMGAPHDVAADLVVIQKYQGQIYVPAPAKPVELRR